MHGLFGNCACTGRRSSRIQLSTPARGQYVCQRAGSYVPDVKLALETLHGIGKYRLSALTELVEPRSRAMQQGAFVSRARIHHGSGGTGFWRWDRARPVVGWRTGRSSGTHRYAGCCNYLKMTSTFLRLILFIVAPFVLRIQAVCREHLHAGQPSDNGCRARAEVPGGATATPFVVQSPIMALSLLSVCF